jgi:hypothetical protein
MAAMKKRTKGVPGTEAAKAVRDCIAICEKVTAEHWKSRIDGGFDSSVHVASIEGSQACVTALRGYAKEIGS